MDRQSVAKFGVWAAHRVANINGLDKFKWKQLQTKKCQKPSSLGVGVQGSGYLLFVKIDYSFPLRIGSDLVPID